MHNDMNSSHEDSLFGSCGEAAIPERYELRCIQTSERRLYQSISFCVQNKMRTDIEQYGVIHALSYQQVVEFDLNAHRDSQSLI